MRLAKILIAVAIAGTAIMVANAAETITYEYDALGRLVKVRHSGDINDNVVSTYDLDPAGNRENVTVTAP